MPNLPAAGGGTAAHVTNYGKKDAADQLFQDAVKRWHERLWSNPEWVKRWRARPLASWHQQYEAARCGGVQQARAEMPPESDLEAFKAWRMKWGNEFYKRLMREAVG